MNFVDEDRFFSQFKIFLQICTLIIKQIEKKKQSYE